MQQTNEVHIGDGVFVSNDGYQIRLRATDAMGFDNLVYLDARVQMALIDYIEIANGTKKPFMTNEEAEEIFPIKENKDG